MQAVLGSVCGPASAETTEGLSAEGRGRNLKSTHKHPELHKPEAAITSSARKGDPILLTRERGFGMQAGVHLKVMKSNAHRARP